MRSDARSLEEKRLSGVQTQDQYQAVHERHRIFPAVFEGRNHKNILDISSGVGIVGRRIIEAYGANLVCNDICQTALRTMERAGLQTVSFDLDTKSTPFPVGDGEFDAVVSLATIEHLIYCDHFMEELHRIIAEDGWLYLSSPNYAGLLYLLPVLLTGKAYHDPLNEKSRYEFYAHVRYFTYHTLLRYVASFRFVPDSVYIAVPKQSTRFLELKRRSVARAFLFRIGMTLLSLLTPARWASEPVMCFRRTSDNVSPRNLAVRKVVL